MAEPILNENILRRDVQRVLEQHDATQKQLELHSRALCALLALVTGKPLMTDELEGLLKELGFVPISPLLVGAAGMPPKSPS